MACFWRYLAVSLFLSVAITVAHPFDTCSPCFFAAKSLAWDFVTKLTNITDSSAKYVLAFKWLNDKRSFMNLLQNKKLQSLRANVSAQLAQFFLLSPGELREFVFISSHSPIFSRYRSRFILSRVRIIAAVFAILTPMWIVIDFATFPSSIATILAIGRILISTAFALLALLCRCSPSTRHARVGISLLVFIPTIFFIFSRLILSGIHFNAMGSAMSAGYTFLPFVLMSGLALFPLVVAETLLFALPLLFIFIISLFFHEVGVLPGIDNLIVFWLLLLIAVVGSLASLSQLQLMKNLFNQSSIDPLTQTMNRRSGEHVLALQFAQAKRQRHPLSFAFLDLDDFKRLNDEFGHPTGDMVLLQAADTFRQVLRDGDAVIRWGGEEFVLIFPFSNAEQTAKRLESLLNSHILQRPDGQVQTWSSGVAALPDPTKLTWQELLNLADVRMYRAKKAGKARVVFSDETNPDSPLQ